MPKLDKPSTNGKNEVKKTAPARVKPAAPIHYEKFEHRLCTLDDAITEATAKVWLGWETGAEAAERMQRDKLDRLEDNKGREMEPALTDYDSHQVYLWHAARNREFVERYAKGYAQDILEGKWAGPLTMPGETVNGETISISRTAEVISGQKRLAAVVLACQLFRKYPDRYPFWKKLGREPVIESLVAFGVSDKDEVIQTLDNTQPRTRGDVLYSTDKFKDLKTTTERREMSRMQAIAEEYVWKRSGHGQMEIVNEKLITNASLATFSGNHKTLVECVAFMMDKNKDRDISMLTKTMASGLSPGECAGALYLMASRNSDADDYRNTDPPSEKAMDLSFLNKAKEFWTTFQKNQVLRQAIARAWKYCQDKKGQGVEGDVAVTRVEKMAVIARAWSTYLKKEEIEAKDIANLGYTKDKDGLMAPSDLTPFGGIDLGPNKRELELDDENKVSEKEASQAIQKASIKKRAGEQLSALAAKVKAKTSTSAAVVNQAATLPVGGKLPTKITKKLTPIKGSKK
jgi:hypothetical protein